MLGCFSSSPAASSRVRNSDILTLPQKQRMPGGLGLSGKKPTRKSLGANHAFSRVTQPICYLSCVCLCLYLFLGFFLPPSFYPFFLSLSTHLFPHSNFFVTQCPPPGFSEPLSFQSCCHCELHLSLRVPGAFPRVRSDGTSSSLKPASHTETTGFPWTRCSSVVQSAVTKGRWPHGQNLGNWLISLKMDVWEINSAADRV